MRILGVLLLITAATIAQAQSTEPDLKTRLLHKPLYLRGFWHDDNLKFDTAGALLTPSKPTTFTLAGIEITKVQLKSDRLMLQGRRVGLVFKNFTPQRIVLNAGKAGYHVDEVMHLEISAPPSGDYGPALDLIFAQDLPEIVPTLPPWWHKFALDHLVADPPPKSTSPAPSSAKRVGGGVTAPSSPKRVGGGVTAPKLLSAHEPDFTPFARALQQSGKCLVSLQVGIDGKPMKLAIVRAIGLGLDENALVAVQAYRFQPALENGNPVIVEMHVEVSFQIY